MLTNLWHEGEPLEDGEDALKVIWHCGVCDSIIVHDLDPSQLVIGSINFSAQNLPRNTNNFIKRETDWILKSLPLKCFRNIRPTFSPLLPVLSVNSPACTRFSGVDSYFVTAKN